MAERSATANARKLIMGALLTAAGGGISWAVHELVDTRSVKALLVERVSVHDRSLANADARIERDDERIRQLEIAFARLAEVTDTLARVVEREQERERDARKRR